MSIQNEPVVTAASIAGLISALVVFLRAMGWIQLSDSQFEALMGFVVLALPIGFAFFYARPKVTPLADPKDNAGNALVPQQDAGRG